MDHELYQDTIIDHYKRPRNFRKIDDPYCVVNGDNPLCGDHLTVYLKLEGDVVKEITFEGGGCAISTASASIMTETLVGKTLEEAKKIFKAFYAMVKGEHKEDNLGKLEVFSGVCKFPARVKCATLAWHTFEAAINKETKTVSTEKGKENESS